MSRNNERASKEMYEQRIAMLHFQVREELVGKRFILITEEATRRTGKNHSLENYSWKQGYIRACSVRDIVDKELQVLVEFDGVSWERREWIKIYERAKPFFVENTIIWAPRIYRSNTAHPTAIPWPALVFFPLVGNLGQDNDAKHLVEYFGDKTLNFIKGNEVQAFKDCDENLQQVFCLNPRVHEDLVGWQRLQKTQACLMRGTETLTGARVTVYRLQLRQWYTGCITAHNLKTRELHVMDDNVLQTHPVHPALVQINLMANDDELNRILHGEQIKMLPTRRQRNSQIYFQANCPEPKSQQGVTNWHMVPEMNTTQAKTGWNRPSVVRTVRLSKPAFVPVIQDLDNNQITSSQSLLSDHSSTPSNKKTNNVPQTEPTHGGHTAAKVKVHKPIPVVLKATDTLPFPHYSSPQPSNSPLLSSLRSTPSPLQAQLTSSPLSGQHTPSPLSGQHTPSPQGSFTRSPPDHPPARTVVMNHDRPASVNTSRKSSIIETPDKASQDSSPVISSPPGRFPPNNSFSPVADTVQKGSPELTPRPSQTETQNMGHSVPIISSGVQSPPRAPAQISRKFSSGAKPHQKEFLGGSSSKASSSTKVTHPTVIINDSPSHCVDYPLTSPQRSTSTQVDRGHANVENGIENESGRTESTQPENTQSTNTQHDSTRTGNTCFHLRTIAKIQLEYLLFLEALVRFQHGMIVEAVNTLNDTVTEEQFFFVANFFCEMVELNRSTEKIFRDANFARRDKQRLEHQCHATECNLPSSSRTVNCLPEQVKARMKSVQQAVSKQREDVLGVVLPNLPFEELQKKGQQKDWELLKQQVQRRQHQTQHRRQGQVGPQNNVQKVQPPQNKQEVVGNSANSSEMQKKQLCRKQNQEKPEEPRNESSLGSASSAHDVLLQQQQPPSNLLRTPQHLEQLSQREQQHYERQQRQLTVEQSLLQELFQCKDVEQKTILLQHIAQTLQSQHSEKAVSRNVMKSPPSMTSNFGNGTAENQLTKVQNKQNIVASEVSKAPSEQHVPRVPPYNVSPEQLLSSLTTSSAASVWRVNENLGVAPGVIEPTPVDVQVTFPKSSSPSNQDLPKSASTPIAVDITSVEDTSVDMKGSGKSSTNKTKKRKTASPSIPGVSETPSKLKRQRKSMKKKDAVPGDPPSNYKADDRLAVKSDPPGESMPLTMATNDRTEFKKLYQPRSITKGIGFVPVSAANLESTVTSAAGDSLDVLASVSESLRTNNSVESMQLPLGSVIQPVAGGNRQSNHGLTTSTAQLSSDVDVGRSQNEITKDYRAIPGSADCNRSATEGTLEKTRGTIKPYSDGSDVTGGQEDAFSAMLDLVVKEKIYPVLDQDVYGRSVSSPVIMNGTPEVLNGTKKKSRKERPKKEKKRKTVSKTTSPQNTAQTTDDSLLQGVDAIRDMTLPGVDATRDLALPGVDALLDMALPGVHATRDVALPGVDAVRDMALPGIDTMHDVALPSFDTMQGMSHLYFIANGQTSSGNKSKMMSAPVWRPCSTINNESKTAPESHESSAVSQSEDGGSVTAVTEETPESLEPNVVSSEISEQSTDVETDVPCKPMGATCAATSLEYDQITVEELLTKEDKEMKKTSKKEAKKKVDEIGREKTSEKKAKTNKNKKQDKKTKSCKKSNKGKVSTGEDTDIKQVNGKLVNDAKASKKSSKAKVLSKDIDEGQPSEKSVGEAKASKKAGKGKINDSEMSRKKVVVEETLQDSFNERKSIEKSGKSKVSVGEVLSSDILKKRPNKELFNMTMDAKISSKAKLTTDAECIRNKDTISKKLSGPGFYDSVDQISAANVGASEFLSKIVESSGREIRINEKVNTLNAFQTGIKESKIKSTISDEIPNTKSPEQMDDTAGPRSISLYSLNEKPIGDDELSAIVESVPEIGAIVDVTKVRTTQESHGKKSINDKSRKKSAKEEKSSKKKTSKKSEKNNVKLNGVCMEDITTAENEASFVDAKAADMPCEKLESPVAVSNEQKSSSPEQGKERVGPKITYVSFGKRRESAEDIVFVNDQSVENFVKAPKADENSVFSESLLSRKRKRCTSPQGNESVASESMEVESNTPATNNDISSTESKQAANKKSSKKENVDKKDQKVRKKKVKKSEDETKNDTRNGSVSMETDTSAPNDGVKQDEEKDSEAKEKTTKTKEKNVREKIPKEEWVYFLQRGGCKALPSMPQCRECRNYETEEEAVLNKSCCRFDMFRRCRSKSSKLEMAGFSSSENAQSDDLLPWVAREEITSMLSLEVSKYILLNVGDEFCNLVKQEEEAFSWKAKGTVAWKRAVRGIREMCDACATTIFNVHWVCPKCGFGVCLDCFRTRMTMSVAAEAGRARRFLWVRCSSNTSHRPQRLVLTHIIPKETLHAIGEQLHEAREFWGIGKNCPCNAHRNERAKIKELTEGDKKVDELGGPLPACEEDKVEPSKSMEESSEISMDAEYTNEKGEPLQESVASEASNEKLNKNESENSASVRSLPETKVVETEVQIDEAPATNKMNNLLNAEHCSEDEDDDVEIGNGLGALSLLSCYGSPVSSPVRSPTVDDTESFDITTAEEILLSRPNATVAESSAMVSTCSEKMDESWKTTGDFSVNTVTPSGESDKPSEMTDVSLPSFEDISARVQPRVTDDLPAPHSWICRRPMLRLHAAHHEGNLKAFQSRWEQGEPVLVSGVHENMASHLWTPEGFENEFGSEKADVVNCKTGGILTRLDIGTFWRGFESVKDRPLDNKGEPTLLKLKDWPPEADFVEKMPTRFNDLMNALPLPEYTSRDGSRNLVARLPDFFVKPDLGPKMYNAYGNAAFPSAGTTNLHIDMSDAVNVMVYVGVPFDKAYGDQERKDSLACIDVQCDESQRHRARDKSEKLGALWHIFAAADANKIRALFHKVASEKNMKYPTSHDPIHDQCFYLDEPLLKRLKDEYGVVGWPIAQFLGDAIFIPAGAPHQVRNLHSCVKAAEDFVSPEHVGHCFKLTEEFRYLSEKHTNHEDKLQVKNIIYHAVKDAVSVLHRERELMSRTGNENV